MDENKRFREALKAAHVALYRYAMWENSEGEKVIAAAIDKVARALHPDFGPRMDAIDAKYAAKTKAAT